MSVVVELVASLLTGTFTLSTVAFSRPLSNFGVTASGVFFVLDVVVVVGMVVAICGNGAFETVVRCDDSGTVPLTSVVVVVVVVVVVDDVDDVDDVVVAVCKTLPGVFVVIGVVVDVDVAACIILSEMSSGRCSACCSSR